MEYLNSLSVGGKIFIVVFYMLPIFILIGIAQTLISIARELSDIRATLHRIETQRERQ